MNVVFVYPPINSLDKDDLAPPLGIFKLIDSIIKFPINIWLFDFNLASISKNIDFNFYDEAVDKIMNCNPDILAISSMCVNSHVSLKIASEIKKKNKKVMIIAGGIHFSSIRKEIKELFPIDIIINGPGDNSLAEIISSLLDCKFEPIDSRNLLKHPWNAYKKIGIEPYFEQNQRKLLYFENGRGCKYNCKFCYSRLFWNHNEQQDIESSIEDICIAYKEGARELFFVNDNFANNRKFVSNFCKELSFIKEKPIWSCYLSVPDIDNDLPTELKIAGCSSVYLGFDVLEKSQKDRIGKSYYLNKYYLEDIAKKLLSVDIIPTCAFILDPFLDNTREINGTLEFSANLRKLGAEISLHYYTDYHRRQNQNHSSLYYDEARVRFMMDCPEIVCKNEYAKKYPYLFPFHSRKIKSTEKYMQGLFLIHSAQNLITNYPYEMVDLVKEKIKLTKIIQEIYQKYKMTTQKNNNNFNVKEIEQECFKNILLTNHNFRAIDIK